MLFKGTSSRTAYDIAREIDSLGGQLDAFTSREYTCLLATVLDEHLPRVIDILTDLFKGSSFPVQEIDRERNVILEEISMIEDTPDEYIHDVCIQNFWPHQPLGRSVIGCRENVQRFTHEELVGYFHQHFLPHHIIITAAGNIHHDSFQELIYQKNFFAQGTAGPGDYVIEPPDSHHHFVHCPRQLEQTHVCLIMEGLPQSHRLRFAGYLLNSILGGGMSSRLFQKIREERGLAYSVFSSLNSFQDTGLVSFYAGTSPGSIRDTIRLIFKELRTMQGEKVTEEELQRAKDQLKGNLMLGLESTANRMSKLARQEIYFGRNFSLNEIIFQIEKVSREDILALAGLLFHTDKFSLAVLGEAEKLEQPLESWP